MTGNELSEVAKLAARLVSIDSSNPSLVAGAAGEQQIADFANAWLEARGFDSRLLNAHPGRPSVLAIHRGTGSGRSIMLNGHLDTVSLASYDGDALLPAVHSGRIYGRGIYDMKAGLAASMVAAATVAQEDHPGDIIVALVADEEADSTGTLEVLRQVGADGAIVAEPTDEAVVLAHRGFVWVQVDIYGRAAHGSRRDLGVDAIVNAGKFLAALGEHDRALSQRAPHSLLGTANIHASTISGGEEMSSYPAHCSVSVERRTLPGESAATVSAEIGALLDKIAAHDPDFRYSVAIIQERNPFVVEEGEAVVEALNGALTSAKRRVPSFDGGAYWTDAALLADAGIPTVLFGVLGAGAHAAEEWVSIESIEFVTSVLVDTIRIFAEL